MEQDPIMKQDNTLVWAAVAGAAIILAVAGWIFLRGGEAEPEAEVAPVVEETVPATPEEPSSEAPVDASTEDAWAGRVGGLAALPLRTSSAEASEMREQLIDALKPLDGASAVAATSADADEFDLFRGLALDLAMRPPVASGETESLESVLENLTHLARVLGKKRTIALAAALDENGAELEPVAAAAYGWLVTRERHGEGAEKQITMARLYDYAAFLLETMGGQAYLRRRLPRQEALAVFYALLIVDRAHQMRISGHGTDPRPHFERARALLETQDLTYREQYLAALDEVESRWP